MDTGLLAELSDEDLELPQVVSRHAWEEMVHSLELQTTVEEVQPGGTVNVHSRTQLPLSKGLAIAEICSGHSPMRQRDLNMQWECGDMRDENKQNSQLPGRNAAVEEDVSKKVPVAADADNLCGSSPHRTTKIHCPRREQMAERQEVKIEARDGHDGIVSIDLILDEEIGRGVPVKDEAVIVAGVDVFEKRG